jgi:hypothetical protein
MNNFKNKYIKYKNKYNNYKQYGNGLFKFIMIIHAKFV